MKLTKQILGAYIGAQVAMSITDEMKYNILALGNLGVTLGHDESVPTIVPYDQCRLLLTPLSKISDEDAYEVAKIDDKNRKFRFDNNRSFRPDQYKASWNGTTMFVERHYKGEYIFGDPIPLIPELMNIEQIDYLRSRNYDLGHGEIKSLIAEGLAKDVTSLNQ